MRHHEHPRTWAEISEGMDYDENEAFREFIQKHGFGQPKQVSSEDLERLLELFRCSQSFSYR